MPPIVYYCNGGVFNDNLIIRGIHVFDRDFMYGLCFIGVWLYYDKNFFFVMTSTAESADKTGHFFCLVNIMLTKERYAKHASIIF